MSRFQTLFTHAGLALGAVAGLAGCSPSAAPTPAAPAAPQVSVLTIQPRHVALKTVLPGRTSPTLIAEVRPQVTGLVQALRFQEAGIGPVTECHCVGHALTVRRRQAAKKPSRL